MTWTEDLRDVVSSLTGRTSIANVVTGFVIAFFAWKLGGMIDRLDLATMQELAEAAFSTLKDLALLCAGYLFGKNMQGFGELVKALQVTPDE